VGDSDLFNAISQWRLAITKQDRAAQEKAEHDLLQLREDLGITELDAFSAALMRVSQNSSIPPDGERLIALTSTATELSPALVPAHFALARVYFADDMLGVARWSAELKDWVTQLWQNPRYRHLLIGNLGAAALFSWIATAVAVLVILTLRRLRYPFHDLHHALFPTAVAFWQSAILLGLLVALPSVFRMGLAPQLLVLFVVISAYLTWRERILLTLLVGTLGLLPTAVKEWVNRSTFEGTPAADVFILEQGGPSAQPIAARLLKRQESSELDFAELYALGRYEQRRGQLDQAIANYKQAALLRPGDARLMTNLGNALLTKGDSEGAAALYTSATQADPNLAAAFFDLARLSQRRMATVREDLVLVETEKAQSALDSATHADPSLLTRPEPPQDNMLANRQLLAVPLDTAELERLTGSDEWADRVSTQLTERLLGSKIPEVVLVYPALMALLALGLGFGRGLLRTSHACEKCGRPVCVRCDPELDLDSPLCNQCVHAFGRKSGLSASTTVRKQIEVRRYQSRNEKLSYGLGLVLSGAGHLFNGETLKGAFYAFVCLFLGFIAHLPRGVFRSSYVWPSPYWTLIPALLAFAFLYGLSLRGLYRRLNS
jgi:Flp pilus assembly protein TadD